MRRLLSKAVFIFVFSIVAANATAAWQDWWQRADQQGFELFEKGQVEQASEVFDDPQWRGTARFKAGQYVQAGAEFSKSPTLDALYNRATTLAHAGELKQSLATFDHLLAQQATHEDGIANRDWVLQQLEQQQAQQDSQQSGQGDQPNQQQSDSAQSEAQNAGQSAQQQEGDNAQSNNDKTQNANSGEQGEQQNAEQSLKSALQEQQPKESPADEQKAEQQQLTEQAQQTEDGQQSTTAAIQEQPYDEATQAIEQQLQRIPDDPAGLLRNKLYVTHQSRYANIREGDQPW